MKEALDFVLSMEFWRMGLLWTLSLLIPYWNLLFASTTPPSRSSPPSFQSSASSPVLLLDWVLRRPCSLRSWLLCVERLSHLLEKTMMEIKRKNESAHLKAFEVDLSSFQSILQFKASLQQWLSHLQMHPSIQLLINDAGIFAASSTCTSEVYDRPVSSRIVNVTSFTHGSGESKGNPYAHVYEYSKCKLLMSLLLKISYCYSNFNVLHVLTLFLLRFSYELHHQLGLMDISCHVSIIFVFTSFFTRKEELCRILF
ncbi:putative NAD(P)-binding domain-containing protein [Rosa chinensis]|uniref:Putative NAD(P)-binding domain-containing protein n=1 Tax=Rosa chinensis TaxID=74649 RepID=A0A2P6PFA4_ROSCH|nr:putative NAD(P)-binding domain-containing protein [Rosa chinensis]